MGRFEKRFQEPGECRISEAGLMRSRLTTKRDLPHSFLNCFLRVLLVEKEYGPTAIW